MSTAIQPKPSSSTIVNGIDTAGIKQLARQAAPGGTAAQVGFAVATHWRGAGFAAQSRVDGFTFNGRKVETRFLWKASADRWVFASYVWNEEQTDAVLAPADGVPGAAEIGSGRRHDIPAETECRACHGTRHVAPLGRLPRGPYPFRGRAMS